MIMQYYTETSTLLQEWVYCFNKWQFTFFLNKKKENTLLWMMNALVTTQRTQQRVREKTKSQEEIATVRKMLIYKR